VARELAAASEPERARYYRGSGKKREEVVCRQARGAVFDRHNAVTVQ
jgi:hypothetical protein